MREDINGRDEMNRPDDDPMLHPPASEEMQRREADPATEHYSDERTRETEPAIAGTRPDVTSPLSGYRLRFDQLQAEFIEHPREAVEKAESLIEEAVDQMMNMLRKRVETVRAGVGDGADTERLRIAMRDYRQLIDSMGERF